MKKIFFLLCSVFMLSTMSVSAQKFFEIDKVKQTGETTFMVAAGAQELQVNPLIYREVNANPQAYLLVIYTGEKASCITIAPKESISYVVAEVQEVKPEGDKWLVVLSSGMNYTSSNQDWGTVIPGQRVSYAVVNGLTKVIARRPHTVEGDVELTTKVPVSPAPTAPIVILDAENRIVGLNL